MNAEQNADQTLNPYAAALSGLDPLAVLAATAARLEELSCAMTPEQLEAPRAPGKWSPRQILAHLADCEIVFSFRLRQTLAGTENEAAPLLQPFDQDIWAQRYAAYDAPSALALFRSLRTWNLALLKTITPEDTRKPAHHPERGHLTFQIILETIAGHDRHHLQQLDALLSA